VLNAGVRGYGLDQIVLRAERLAPIVKPGAIVLAFIEDDINRAGLSVRQGVHKPYFLTTGDGVSLRNVPVPTAPVQDPLDPLRHVLGYSYLLDYVMRQVDAIDFWHGDARHTGVDVDLLACRLMQRFAALAKRQDVHAIVVALRNDLAEVDEREAARLRRRVSAVLDCARLAGLGVIDTHDGFAAAGVDRAAVSFYVDRHFSARGNALVAGLIAAVLRELDP
jgi:hypothetical protein